MFLLKVAPVLLFVLAIRAEKKIELQDIEEDNLKSEKQKDLEDQPEARSQTDDSSLPLEFLKNGFARYFEASQQHEPPRYVQQYAVSEAPERVSVTPKPQYGPPPTAQQSVVGYLSNVPMQIYFVPQYYSEPEQASPQHGVQYQTISRVAGYHGQSEPVHSHPNYVDVQAYVTPTPRTYVQQYTQPVAYVGYPQATIAPVQATVAPVLAYQMPLVQYQTSLLSSQQANAYYQSQQYPETNAVEEIEDNEIDNQKYYSTPTEASHVKSQEFPRYYNSRNPLREEYRGPSQLPHPSPLLLKPPPSHLAHLAKTLPMYRPLAKPVYGTANVLPTPLTPRPIDPYGPKRRPNSLLDSYIPSSVQVEYLKRGLSKDPLVLYETLSNARHFPPPPVIPRHYERGFLPNQMYHTAAGGVTFGHHKRSSKGDKVPQK